MLNEVYVTDKLRLIKEVNMRTIAHNTMFEDIFNELNRVAIGFEPTLRRLNDVKNNFSTNTTGYPPYDLEKIDENHYRISLAVAGFKDTDLEVELHDDQLRITGEKKEDQTGDYIYRGIASRAFTRIFHIADHVRVDDVRLENGLLTIDLVREVPESMKPRRLSINGPRVIDAKL
jgi:molecular chaperone IbpA